MKFLLITLACIAVVVADVSHLSPSGNRLSRPVLDSATQGPNPQDIATPEPEYIDIDLPEPPKPAPKAPAPAPIARSRPISFAAPRFGAPEPAPAHSYGPDGYRYKRPVNYRRYYRVRF